MKLSLIYRLSLVAACALTLTHCKYMSSKTGVGNQTKLYQSAKQTAPLQVPTDVIKHTEIGSQTEPLPTTVIPKVLTTVPLPPGSLAQQVQSGEVPKTALNVKLVEPK